MPNPQPSLLRALGLGVVAGMRSMTAPALLSYHAERYQNPPLKDTPLESWSAPEAPAIFGLAAAGEIVADKLPFTPDRTMLPSVVFRVLSGGAVGAACTAREEGYEAAGAALGALGALVSTYGMHRLRKDLGEATGLPNVALGLMEDALAISTGLLALRATK